MAASHLSPSSVSRVRRIALGLFLALAALEAYVLWPVCVPVPNEQLADFQPHISEREEKVTNLGGKIECAPGWNVI